MECGASGGGGWEREGDGGWGRRGNVDWGMGGVPVIGRDGGAVVGGGWWWIFNYTVDGEAV